MNMHGMSGWLFLNVVDGGAALGRAGWVVFAWVTRLGRSFGVAGWQAADLQQLQAECFELVDHPYRAHWSGSEPTSRVS